jgi:hypothetical protein
MNGSSRRIALDKTVKMGHGGKRIQQNATLLVHVEVMMMIRKRLLGTLLALLLVSGIALTFPATAQDATPTPIPTATLEPVEIVVLTSADINQGPFVTNHPNENVEAISVTLQEGTILITATLNFGNSQVVVGKTVAPSIEGNFWRWTTTAMTIDGVEVAPSRLSRENRIYQFAWIAYFRNIALDRIVTELTVTPEGIRIVYGSFASNALPTATGG